MTWAAVAIGGTSLVGGLIAGQGAKSAAQTQANSAQQALQFQKDEFNTITGQESPYMQAGQGAQSQLNYLLGIGTPGQQVQAGKMGVGGQPGTASSSTAGGYGSLLTPFNTDTFHQMSPAYQFQLEQGQQGVLNQDAAAQGSLSGAALKDLISFNQGSANTAFNNAFSQYQTQQQNIYSRLGGVAQLGQNAASNTGAQGVNLAGSAGQAAIGVGTALAGGQVGAANAYSGALQSAAPWLTANANQGNNFYNPNSINDESNYSTALNPQSPANNYWPANNGGG